MIIKILTLTRIKWAKIKGVGRGLTLTIIILHPHKNFRERVQKEKRWQEQDKIGRHHCSTIVGTHIIKGTRNEDAQF
jgi:hypothetical protein